jgi:hypothetical protein
MTTELRHGATKAATPCAFPTIFSSLTSSWSARAPPGRHWRPSTWTSKLCWSGHPGSSVCSQWDYQVQAISTHGLKPACVPAEACWPHLPGGIDPALCRGGRYPSSFRGGLGSLQPASASPLLCQGWGRGGRVDAPMVPTVVFACGHLPAVLLSLSSNKSVH